MNNIKQVNLSLSLVSSETGYVAIMNDKPEYIAEGETFGEAIENLCQCAYGDIDKIFNRIDNFSEVSKLLDFTENNTFYMVMIIQRRKENPDMKKSERIINTYFFYSIEDMDKLKNKIIDDCFKYNARAYINLNRLDTQHVALNTIKLISEYLINGQYQQVKNAYVTACGNNHSEKHAKWVIDVDTKDSQYVLKIKGFLELLYQEAKVGNGIITVLPTRNGYHIICRGFNLSKFTPEFPEITVNKNSPTLLYC